MRVDGWTLLLQAINFLILVWLLRHFLYRPVLAVIAERQAATERVRTEAEAARSEAETLRRGLEETRAGLAGERDRLLAEARTQADAERAALRDAGRAEAEHLLADARTRLEEERRQAEGALRRQAAALGGAVAGRLLRGAGGNGLDQRLLEAACRSVEGLPEAERHALAGEAAPVPVRLAAAAPPSDAAPWQARLAAALGRPVDLRVEEAPDLIAGVELHFPHTVVRHSWKQALAEATEELTRDDDAHAGA